MRVIFHRLAEGEYQDVCRTLRRQRASAVPRFVAAVDGAVARITANPSIGSPIFGPFRWVRVGQFRYVLYYRQLAPDLALIYAVAHTSRRPGYWLRRVNRP
jgi:toxin ParE1/3/4